MGVDVGADRLHVVVLDAAGAVASTAVLDPCSPEPFDALLAALPAGTPVAIDGPAGLSTGARADDPTVSRKFRTARGCEIQLGRQRGIWVPWVTPMAGAPIEPWMAVAIDLHGRVADGGHVPLETYPHGVFVTLAGRRLPRKTTAAGLSARVGVLRAAGIEGAHLKMWSHDALDATACALVAWDHHRGRAVAVTDELDATSIWLPA